MGNRRVLVVGAAGRLGAAIVDVFADRVVIAHTRASLDITDAALVTKAVQDAAPAVIVNCAAFNDVDGAEDRPAEALATNALALRTLARAADVAGATLVHYGSDFVFDGTATEPYREDASPSPMSTYAASKLLGEWFALDAARGFVLRVESLFGGPRGLTGRRGSLDGIVEGLQQAGAGTSARPGTWPTSCTSRRPCACGRSRCSPIASCRRATLTTSPAPPGISSTPRRRPDCTTA